MARDFAKKRRPAAKTKRASANKKSARQKSPARTSTGSGWRWYGGGLLTGVFLSFLVYLGTLPPGPGQSSGQGQDAGAIAQADAQPPKPRFDFYKMLPRQTIDVEPEPASSAAARTTSTAPPEQYFLVQAGSFRQLEDAERRRAELLLLGLEPTIEETNGDKGRWYRVYIGPYQSRSKMAKARSLTAAQNIDTLLLMRNKSG